MADPSEPPARERMVIAAGQLFRERGFVASSMRDIVEASGAPWGSLNHYFPGGKQQLALEAIALGREAVGAGIDHAFATTKTPAAALQWFFDYGGEHLDETEFRFGCPLATIALERAGSGDELAKACAEGFDDWAARFATGLEAGGVPTQRATALGQAILAQYEGALLLARVQRSTEPMRNASRAVQALLNAATA